MKDDGTVRGFDTGATRSSAKGRIDPEGFISPLSLERYCEYLLKHQEQADGTMRESDNWQKGMPLVDYIKGMWRHVLHAWQRHRGWTVTDPKAAANIEEDLCAIIFNAQGYLHELLKADRTPTPEPTLTWTVTGNPEEWPEYRSFAPDQVIVVDDPARFPGYSNLDIGDPPPPPGPCSCCNEPDTLLSECPFCRHCEGGSDFNPVNRN